MSAYTACHLDEIAAEQWPYWAPIRHHFGIRSFGINGWRGTDGDEVIKRHHESESGASELYVVISGRATFDVGGEEIDAPAGTLVFVRPGTLRKAIAAEDGTAILAVGAKPGIVFEPSPWEDVFAAYSYAELGDLERGREVVRDAIAKLPDAWQGYYNAACMEARFGDQDEAVSLLAHAVELGGDAVREAAKTDTDFDSVRERPDFPL